MIFQETYESVNDNIGEDNLKTAAATAHDMPVIGASLWEQTVLPDKEYLQQVSFSSKKRKKNNTTLIFLTKFINSVVYFRPI